MHYAFILPTILLLGVFAYYPVASALYHGFFDWDGFTEAKFVGIDNFTKIAKDPIMRAALGNVLKLALFSVIISVTVPLLVARLILSVKSVRLQYFFRVLFVVPMIMTKVVIYLIWQFVYDPNVGLANQLLTALGLPPQGWLGDPHEALYGLMGIGFPWVDGFALLIFTAGLQNISSELTEAAAIDGASAWRSFLQIQIPLLLPQIRLIATLNMVWAIQDFTTVLILTQGGPGTSTMVPGMVLYSEAFQNANMGYACAIGTLMFAIMLALTYLILRAGSRRFGVGDGQ
jgi:raffinose/stachyose/melibiose transport system permease protein